jgi:hypothetical protein
LLEVPCQEIANVDMLANCFRVQCVNTFAGLGDLLHAVRVRLTGETILHAVEAREPGALEAAIRAALQDMPQLEIWIESVEVDLRGLSDRTSLVTRQDPVGEVVRLVDALLADATQLREWVSQHQDGLPRLPGELPPTGIESLNDQALRALLSDAESTVLARLAIDGE